VADEGNVSTTTFEVALVATDGRVLASTMVPASARWTVGSGANAAYWVADSKLQMLTERGAVTTLATVPSTESGRVVISPDGAQWAYATTSQSAVSGIVANRLYRGGIGRPAQLVAARTADPAHPQADTPGPWQYYLLSWTARGILIERQPVGGCGCGTPFDMQMSAGFAVIDPLTGAAAPLGATTSCPVSGVGSDATLACFHVSSTGASESLQLLKGALTTHDYQLSGKSDGGDATFNGSTLAYATVPSTAGGCGGPDWRPATTLHIMNIETGDGRVVGGVGLRRSRGCPTAASWPRSPPCMRAPRRTQWSTWIR
jgi:hypothetical protein